MKLFSFLKKDQPLVGSLDQKKLDQKLVLGLAKSRLPNRRQLKYLPRLLTPSEALAVKILLGTIFFCLIILGVRFYQRHAQYLPASGGKYLEALIGSPRYINPLFSPSNDVDQDLTQLVYSGLLKYDQQHNLVPDLAESYEISADQKTYTFHLRKNVRWHDGVDFSANDVVFTLDTIQAPEFKSPLYATFKGVGVEKVDDFTVRLSLKSPLAPFISSLTFGILPEHLWMDVTASNMSLVEYNLKPIGTGPFKFYSLTRDSDGNLKTYSLKKNIDYYQRPAYLNELDFKFYPDITTAVEAVKNKSVEGISYLPSQDKAEVAKKNHITFHSLSLPQYTALFFNEKKSLFKDRELRRALAYGLDRNKILSQVLNGDGQVVNSPILPGFLGQTNDLIIYNYNSEKAKQMLDADGWKLESGKTVRNKGDSELTITLTTVNQPEYVQVANLIKADWAQIGVNIEIRLIESDSIQKDVIKPRDYDLLLYGEIIGADPDPYPFWHSSQQVDPGLGLAIFYNKQSDQLLEAARQTNDTAVRAQKYIEFQKIIAEEIPTIFLYSPVYTYGTSPKIKGFTLTRIISPADRFNGVENWYLKTKTVWR